MRSKDTSTIEKDKHSKRGKLSLPKPKRKADENYVVRLLCDSDQRLAIVRTLKRRIDQLEQETGADTLAKSVLCHRAVWLWSYLETLEVNAVETGQFNSGAWCQATNTLVGLLRTLGLERKVNGVEDLSSIINGNGHSSK